MKRRLLTPIVCALFALCLPIAGCSDGADRDGEQKRPDPLPVLVNGATDYRVLVDFSASAEVKRAVADFCDSFEDAFGVGIALEYVYENRYEPIPEDAHEILFGQTNRPAGREICESVAEPDSYRIAVSSRSLVFAAENGVALRYAVRGFIEEYMPKESGKTEFLIDGDLDVRGIAEDAMRDNWELDIPYPVSGDLAAGVYNAGPGLADDTRRVTSEDSKMQVLRKVKSEDCAAYVERLQKKGFELICDRETDVSRFALLKGDGKIVDVAYFSKTGEMHVETDVCSVPVTDFGYTETGLEKTTLYQWGLYYDPNNQVTSKTVNCGMMYIVKLSDSSLFVIDGGHIYQCSQEAIEGLWSFMREITGTPEDGTVRIAAWYITHAHGDHVSACGKLLNRYHDRIDLQRVTYNFPSYQARSAGYDDNTTVMKQMIRKFYPDVPFLKLHTGMRFSLSDVGFDVLYTHEDAVSYDTFAKASDNNGMVPFPLNDYNCTSTILRMTMEGKTVLFLGDTNIETEKVVSTLTAASLWKSDAVQVSHHCFNYLNTLYPWIAAPVALLPNSYFGAHTPENTPKLKTVLDFVKDDMIFYEGSATYGFQVVGGEFRAVFEAPVTGTVYDGSGY